ncbi:hypothetical protein RR46_07370 [Papilio xuthus]|uniref:Uncharacterized protein n=1 Tax=Papilio xuthus TaxID=66420 RepID=A0A194PX80_PAPXU|nr:hypothetical protein RR46_07370 [Papilio xuthus]
MPQERRRGAARVEVSLSFGRGRAGAGGGGRRRAVRVGRAREAHAAGAGSSGHVATNDDSCCHACDVSNAVRTYGVRLGPALRRRRVERPRPACLPATACCSTQ